MDLSKPFTTTRFRISHSALVAATFVVMSLALLGCRHEVETAPPVENSDEAPALATEPTNPQSIETGPAATAPKPTEADTRPSAESFAKIMPTTAHQASQVIDFLSLERFEPKDRWDKKELAFQNFHDFTRFFYESDLPVSKLAPRYTQILKKLNWKAFADSEATKYSDDRLSIHRFSKDDFLLSLMFQKLEKGASVDFTLKGNIDARQIPLPAVREALSTTANMTLNKTALNLEELETFYDRVLGEHGWQRHLASANEADDPEQDRLHYRCNAMRIRVRLTDGTLYIVPSLLIHDFPALPDATDLLVERTACTFTTNTAVSEVVAFYEQQMATVGWKHRPEMQDVSPRFGQLFFSREDGQGLLVNVMPKEEATRVEMGILEPKKLADLALHRSLLKKVRSTYLVTGEANMLTLNQFYNSINYRTSMTAKELARYYTKTLTSRGWKFVFEPDIEGDEAKLWLRRESNEEGETENIHVKIIPYGKESEVEVLGELRALIEGK